MTILIVDDDPVQCRLLEGMLQKFDYETVVLDNGDAALTLLAGADGARIDCVILDLVMPNLDGLGVLARLRQAAIKVPVIVQTAHGGIDNVVSAMRAGAVDFVVKPVGAERLQVSLRNALNTSALEGELARIKHSRSGTLGFADIITKSAAMQAVLRMAEKAATSTIPVLISGESGVGKELIARAIHGSGERRAKPFIAVNCGAMPENLVESILFGHEKGSFTGATERHVGKFVEASGGTLFLDEVGELPAAAQVKLLRAIQEGEVEPVGARKPVKVDVPHHLGHQSRSDRRRESRPLPRGPVLPPARLSDHGAAAARAPRRHPGAGPAFSGALCRRRGQAHPPDHARGAARARGLPLARQYPPARKHGVPRRGAGRGRHHRACGISANCGAGLGPAAGAPAPTMRASRWCPTSINRSSLPAPASRTDPGRRRPRRPPPEPMRCRCSTPPARCGRWKSSRRSLSGTPLPIIGARCRRWRGGCKSAARRSTASSKRWA